MVSPLIKAAPRAQRRACALALARGLLSVVSPFPRPLGFSSSGPAPSTYSLFGLVLSVCLWPASVLINADTPAQFNMSYEHHEMPPIYFGDNTDYSDSNSGLDATGANMDDDSSLIA